MALAILPTVVVLVHDNVEHGDRDHRARARLGRRRGRRDGHRPPVAMTAMPQLVSLFNAVGGGAAALIALGDAIHHDGSVPLGQLPVSTTLATVLDLLIGGVTFSGSLVAAGKLQGGSRAGRSCSAAGTG